MLRTSFISLLIAGVIAGLPMFAQAAGEPEHSKLTEQVSIKGRDFYKDGKPWQPKGVVVVAFARPKIVPVSANSPAWMNDPSTQKGRAWWGQEEMNAAKRIFGGDTIRFAVSQPGLDPQSPIYDPQYLREILGVVKEARNNGFVVILLMSAQKPSGVAGLSCMPDDPSTVRAWQTLAVPGLIHDKGVMFELFAEPCKSIGDAQSKEKWATGMQAIISAVRKEGSTNILILDGLLYSRITNGLFPLVHDTLADRLALAVHPYLMSTKNFANEKQWHDSFGASAEQYPMIATDWNATPTNGCPGKQMPEMATQLLRYMESLHIGLTGWAIDSGQYGLLVKDHTSFEPSDYSTFKDCKDGSASGAGKLLVNYPND